MLKVKQLLTKMLVEIKTIKTDMVSLNDIYPVGSIYMSVNSTSPATLFGGTWEQLQNTFLLAAGSSYTAGSTGGAATVSYTPAGTNAAVTLTAAQSGLREHTHAFTDPTYKTSGSDGTHSHNVYRIKCAASGNVRYAAQSSASGFTQETYSVVGSQGGHGHTISKNTSGSVTKASASAATASHNHTFTGTAATINNMPPYLTVYMWKRTA